MVSIRSFMAGIRNRVILLRWRKKKKTHSVLRDKWRESTAGILPIAALVLLLCGLAVPLPVDALAAFGFATLLLMCGMTLFNQGTEMSMTPIGQSIGLAVTRGRKTALILFSGFLTGFLVTVAEPDLTVLAGQVADVPNLILILCVALGVGVFLSVAMLRILKRIPLRRLLFLSYGLVFALALLAPKSFLAVAFDSGGVTTGPMTVPFILGFGLGISAIRNDENSENDSFGLVALASVGPILAVMALGMIYHPEKTDTALVRLTRAPHSMALFDTFVRALPHYLKEVALALAPIVCFFLFFEFTALHIRGARLRHILIGLVYTYAGLVIFLLGVNVGFMPAGFFIGEAIGSAGIRWLLVPLGMVIGWFIVSAEPAVQVLTQQVYEITAGAVPKKALSLSLSVGVSISVGLAMLRVLTGIPIMAFLVPGYAIAFALTFFTQDVFTAIAFDSGGVASGPMTATFLLPLAMGACSAAGSDITENAFGVVAMVAMTPLITIQIMGCIWGRGRRGQRGLVLAPKEEIIEF